jgi:hypothetical protein
LKPQPHSSSTLFSTSELFLPAPIIPLDVDYYPLSFGPTLFSFPHFSTLSSASLTLPHPTCLYPVFLCLQSLLSSPQTVLLFRRVPLSSNSNLTHSRRFTPLLQSLVACWYVSSCFRSFVLSHNKVRGQGQVGVQIDSAAVQTEGCGKEPIVDEHFFFCMANDSVSFFFLSFSPTMSYVPPGNRCRPLRSWTAG